MRCYNCKGRHDTVAAVKACHEIGEGGALANHKTESIWPPSEAQVNYVLTLQAERNLPDGYAVKTSDDLMAMDRAEVSDIIVMLKMLSRKSGTTTTNTKGGYTMPAGRYALHEDGVWMFYQIDKPDKGKWAGYTFIKRLIGSPGDYTKVAMASDARYKVLAIIEANQQQALKDFGLQSGTCGMCGSPLTDPQSLARGIGPICYSKTGW